MDWITQIDKITKEFDDLCNSLTTDELNWKPDADSWSLAQNLDHLIVINQSYFPVLEKLQSGKYKQPFIAKIGFLVSLSEKMILNSVKPDRNRKMKTFSVWEPNSSQIEVSILQQFKEHQDELKGKIIASEELIKKNIVIHSPASKNIVYRLKVAFEIIVTHEKRHLQQVKEILSLMPISHDDAIRSDKGSIQD